jgi:hypothetical protein
LWRIPEIVNQSAVDGGTPVVKSGDVVGFPGLFRQSSREVLEERHGRRSIIVTSQIPVDRWHDVIGDPTYADAILDRLVHNAHRINLGGESLRKRRSGAASS